MTVNSDICTQASDNRQQNTDDACSRLEDIRSRVNETPGGQWHWDKFTSDEVALLLALIDGQASDREHT